MSNMEDMKYDALFGDADTRMKVAGREGITEDVAMVLASDVEHLVRVELARNKHLPQPVFKVLEKDTSNMVKTYLAENPAVGGEILVRLAASGLAKTAMNNPSFPTSRYWEMYEEGGNDNYYLLAESFRTPADILAGLKNRAFFTNGPRIILTSLSKNPSTPAPMLERLAFEGFEYFVSTNPSAPPELLGRIFDNMKCNSVYKNPNCPMDIVEEGLRGKWQQRILCVVNPSLDEGRIMRLLRKERSVKVVSAIVSRRDCTASILQVVADRFEGSWVGKKALRKLKEKTKQENGS